MSGKGAERKQKFVSEVAADKALKQISSMEMLEQLNLFEMIVQLYSIDGLTRLENEELQNPYIPEIRRKNLLLTRIIPGKGHYKGMQMLRRSLKKTGQHAILNKLNKAYEKAVDALIANNLQLHHPSSVGSEASMTNSVMTANSSDVDCISITSQELNADLLYRGRVSRKSRGGSHHQGHDGSSTVSSGSSSGSSSSDEDYDDDILDGDGEPNVIRLDNFGEPCVQESTQDCRTSALVTPFRERSSHMFLKSNPRKLISNRAELSTSTDRIESGQQPVQSATLEEPQRKNTATLGSIQSVLRHDIPVLKIVIVGDTSTGKTSLLDQYIYNRFSALYQPTIPVDFHCKELACNDKKYMLHLWDTVGQERFKAITQAFYRNATAALVVYDVTNKSSLEHCLQWKEEIDSIVYLINGDPIPVLLLANKVDCGKLDGEQFSKEHGFVGYFETSAKTGQGIREAIHFILKKVHQLSCAHGEPVVRTLNRNHNTITLHWMEGFNYDATSNQTAKCCLYKT